tara:strand:- start:472 stop:648 length:177 start_codon:yes stop_codon:yes gene_type:complete
MNQMFNTDISNCIIALENYIIFEEQDLVNKNAGDTEWQELEPFRVTLNNLRYLETIYG